MLSGYKFISPYFMVFFRILNLPTPTTKQDNVAPIEEELPHAPTQHYLV